jgi:hypothetical protein
MADKCHPIRQGLYQHTRQILTGGSRTLPDALRTLPALTISVKQAESIYYIVYPEDFSADS